MRILIVGFSKGFSQILKNKLEESGYIVEIQNDNLSSFNKMYKRFDTLVFNLDIGLDTIKQIRKIDNRIIIIVISINKNSSNLINAFNFGADEFFAMPLCFEEFILKINNLNNKYFK